MNFLSKLNFVWKRPKVVIVTGNSRACAKEAIFQVLKPHFKVGKEIVLFEGVEKKFNFLLKKSRLPILVVTHVGEYHPDREFFAGEAQETKEITELANKLPSHSYLILNFDDERIKKLAESEDKKVISYGFSKDADFQVKNVRKVSTGQQLEMEINLGHQVRAIKINRFGRHHIYAALVKEIIQENFKISIPDFFKQMKK